MITMITLIILFIFIYWIGGSEVRKVSALNKQRKIQSLRQEIEVLQGETNGWEQLQTEVEAADYPEETKSALISASKHCTELHQNKIHEIELLILKEIK